MSTILDPVWPWSRLWDLLLQAPPFIVGAALLAGLASLILPILFLGKGRRFTIYLFGAVLLMSVALLARQTWPSTLADAYHLAGPGVVGWLTGLLIQLGLVLLLIGPCFLVGLSIATYLGSPGVTKQRLTTVGGLRLAAFLLAVLAIARPSLAWPEHEQNKAVVDIAIDLSRSMTTRDEQGSRSRHELVLDTLKKCEAPLARLRDDHQVEVRWYRFDSEVAELSDPLNAGEADGKRTDYGTMLHDLFDRREPRIPMRGLLVIGDGGENGTAYAARAEAARWRSVPCPISTFRCGNPKTTPNYKDVAITGISTESVVPVKGKLKVKVTIDARGFENSNKRLRLFLEGPDEKGVVADREVVAKDARLPLSVGNVVELTCDAPATPGEVKVKVTVGEKDQDNFPLNNTIETFVTVSKEGIRVLLADKPRAFEPLFLYDALLLDPRITVTPVWLRGGKPAPGSKPLGLDNQPYDVIILGDVTAAQLKSLDPDALTKIEKLVAKGSGLIMLGGYSTFGNGGWNGTPLAAILPVELSENGQDEHKAQMTPTEAGLGPAKYLFRLDDKADQRKSWAKLAKLDGYTLLKPKGAPATVLATADVTEAGVTSRYPLLVWWNYSAGGAKGKGMQARVLAFGGDSTYRWVRDEESAGFHARFWKQVVVWLAKQEDAEGNVWVKPDVRRLPVRGELGLQMGLRGKGGGPDLREGKYEAEVIDPAGNKKRVPVVVGKTENRATFSGTQKPGVYRIVVRGKGKDPAGGEVSGETSARVIVYDEDVELMRPAADEEFMKNLARDGGGESLRVEQLPDFLNRLAEQPLAHGKPKLHLRPDWRSTGRSGFLVAFFVVFCVVVSVEWGLRRWWGMV